MQINKETAALSAKTNTCYFEISENHECIRKKELSSLVASKSVDINSVCSSWGELHGAIFCKELSCIEDGYVNKLKNVSCLTRAQKMQPPPADSE
jgi:hypothetical protein